MPKPSMVLLGRTAENNNVLLFNGMPSVDGYGIKLYQYPFTPVAVYQCIHSTGLKYLRKHTLNHMLSNMIKVWFDVNKHVYIRLVSIRCGECFICTR